MVGQQRSVGAVENSILQTNKGPLWRTFGCCFHYGWRDAEESHGATKASRKTKLA